jgi:uncharacterized RDD family membrane protein YckC
VLESNVETFNPPAAVAARAPIDEAACTNCGRRWGNGRSCQFCRQVDGLPVGITLASAGKRFGAMLLDGLLVFATLFIGYLIWALIAYGRGQTPGKQLLGMRCVTLAAGRRAGWGRTFLREMSKGLVRAIAAVTLIGLVAELWLIWDHDNQELWDKIAGTVVVDDPRGEVR